MPTLLRYLPALRGVRFRLLPAVIFCAAFTLTLKLGTIWQDAADVLGPAAATAQEAAAPAETPAAAGKEPAAGNKLAADAKDATAKDATDATAGEGRGERTGRAGNAWFDPALVTDAELDVLQKLSERRAELEKQGREVETRERLLQAAEKRIDAKLAQLKEIQNTVTGLLKRHDKQKEEQIRSVVKIYENMKPKDAARIFEELDMVILLDVVERMREAKTAPIMANMTPAKAKTVTAAMAQRRALPKPGEDKK